MFKYWQNGFGVINPKPSPLTSNLGLFFFAMETHLVVQKGLDSGEILSTLS